MSIIVHTDPKELSLGCEGCESTEARALIDSGNPAAHLCPECFEKAAREAMVEECAVYLEVFEGETDPTTRAGLSGAATILREADL